MRAFLSPAISLLAWHVQDTAPTTLVSQSGHRHYLFFTNSSVRGGESR